MTTTETTTKCQFCQISEEVEGDHVVDIFGDVTCTDCWNARVYAGRGRHGWKVTTRYAVTADEVQVCEFVFRTEAEAEKAARGFRSGGRTAQVTAA